MASGDPTDDSTFSDRDSIGNRGHEPILGVEAQESVDHTVKRILSFNPSRVLAIGCGAGLLLFRVAPYCREYVATDVSAAALRFLSRLDLPRGVTLRQQEAADFTGIGEASFDMVILNSVVHEFPSVDYLMEVLTAAARSLAPGGSLFVGDVRSLPVSDPSDPAGQGGQAPPTHGPTQLARRVSRRGDQEGELALDPSFFAALPRYLPRITQIALHLQRNRASNDQDNFRYDVVLG